MADILRNVSETTKGFLLMLIGGVLLFNKFDLMNYLIILLAIAMIVHGAMLSKLPSKITGLLGQRRGPDSQQ